MLLVTSDFVKVFHFWEEVTNPCICPHWIATTLQHILIQRNAYLFIFLIHKVQ